MARFDPLKVQRGQRRYTRRSQGLKAFGGHAGEMNTRKCGGSAVPTEGCRVARPKGEGAASRAKRVIVINAARLFNFPCWASRSSRGYPRRRERDRGVRKITAVREGGLRSAFQKGGAGVPLKGDGRIPPGADNLAHVFRRLCADLAFTMEPAHVLFSRCEFDFVLEYKGSAWAPASAGAHASGRAGQHFDNLRCSCPIWHALNFKVMPRV